jgi:chemotaxis signal transduction protein
MSSAEHRLARQLFLFGIEQIDGWALGVSTRQVLTVTSIEAIGRVPLASAFVYGIAQWQDRLVTVIDLGAAILGIPADHTLITESTRFLIGQFLIDEHIEIVAWPIQGEAGTFNIPDLVYQAPPPVGISQTVVDQTFSANNQFVLMLRWEVLCVGTSRQLGSQNIMTDECGCRQHLPNN